MDDCGLGGDNLRYMHAILITAHLLMARGATPKMQLYNKR